MELVKNLLMKKIFTPVRDRSLICLRIIHSFAQVSVQATTENLQ